MDAVGEIPSAVNPGLAQLDMSLDSSEDVLAISETENVERDVENALKPIEKKPIQFHFPEEVWEIILSNVTEGDDRANCCRASPVFDRILTETKPVWMFKQILPFICIKAWDGKWSMLTSRLVCQEWCAAIDDYVIPDPNCFYLKNSDEGFERKYCFGNVADIDRFNQTFDGHSRNPFISRSVKIYSSQQNDLIFPSKVLVLLTNYGHHISTLKFEWRKHTPFGHNFRLDSYEFFQQVLIKTPNLRKLIIWAGRNYLGYAVCNPAEHPLPPIPTLETLEIRNFRLSRYFPDSFMKMPILAYASNLQKLSLDDINLGQLLSHQLLLPKLAHLQVREVPNGENLKKLLLLTAPLKTLEMVGLDWCIVSSNIELSTFLSALQNFQLLEEVEMKFCVFEEKVDVSRLTNFSVRQLTLDNVGSNGVPASFNFLQNFKVLENLSVSLGSAKANYLGRNEGEGEVQLYKMFETDQVYESNIWNLMPSLQNVGIHCDPGSWCSVWGNREEFKEYQASRFHPN